MVDIHCHILPAMDDGAKTKQISLELCALGADNGITDIVATPHLKKLHEIDDFLKIRDAKIEDIRREIEQDELPVKLYAGAEVLMSNDIFFSPELAKVTLAGSKYLLVEYEFYDVNFQFIEESINIIKKQGLVPIIAHPERYHFFQRDYNLVNRVAELGVLFQVNINDIVKSTGRRKAINLARAMINAGMVSFIATDAHSIYYRNNGILEFLDSIVPNVDTSDFENLFTNNPAAVITGGEVPYPKYTPIKKKLLG